MPDLSGKSDKEIERWIKNHEDRNQQSQSLYRDLLEERARRAQSKQLLNLERSLDRLKAAAIRQECTSYGDLAKASDIEWSQARQQMNGATGHLDRLVDLCHARGLPLLTAICVNQDRVAQGKLGPKALAGFVAAARRLGIRVTDPREFHRESRDECWRWGQKQSEKA